MATKKRNAAGAFDPTIVSKLSLSKVAVVDSGAGKGVEVLLQKEKVEKAMNLEKLMESIKAFLADASPEMKAGIKAALVAAIEGSEKPKEEPAPPAEPVAAAAPVENPEVKKMLADKETENEALRKQLESITTEREVEQFAKVAADLKYVPGMSTADFGEHLRKMSKTLSKEDYAKALALYKAVNAAIEQSEILKNVGSGAPAATSKASEKLASIATGIMETQKVSFAKALKIAYAQNKPLVAEAAHETFKTEAQDNE